MFKTVATFTLPIELAVAKSKLESEGIECRVFDELTIQTDNFLSNALGGVKLQVLKSDYDKALEILKQGGFISEKQSEPTFLEQKFRDPLFVKSLKFWAKIFFVILGGVLLASIFFS